MRQTIADRLLRGPEQVDSLLMSIDLLFRNRNFDLNSTHRCQPNFVVSTVSSLSRPTMFAIDPICLDRAIERVVCVAMGAIEAMLLEPN